jgi:poly(A) polymerase
MSITFNDLFNFFKEKNEEIYFVGGHVRNILLNHSTLDSDKDLATSAKPEKTIEILKELNLKVYEVGKKFGTIGTIINNFNVEITTFRSDVYNNENRKPEVKFSKSLKEDLSRRDFTINAMALDYSNNLIDPFNGIQDLQRKIIDTPIDPQISLTDDPLRILRACRFAAKYKFTLSNRVKITILNIKDKLSKVSKERIFNEINKILTIEHSPSYGLELMKKLGIIEELFPLTLHNMSNFNKNQGIYHDKTVWYHTMYALDNTPPISKVRWATLFHDVGKPDTYRRHPYNGACFYDHNYIGELLWKLESNNLKISKEFTKDVAWLIKNHMRPLTIINGGSSTKASRKLIRDAKHRLNMLFNLAEGDIKAHVKHKTYYALDSLNELKEKIFSIEKNSNVTKICLPKGLGNELIKKFNKPPGPWIGKIMNNLTKMLVDGTLKEGSNLIEEANKLFKNNNF